MFYRLPGWEEEGTENEAFHRWAAQSHRSNRT